MLALGQETELNPGPCTPLHLIYHSHLTSSLLQSTPGLWQWGTLSIASGWYPSTQRSLIRDNTTLSSRVPTTKMNNMASIIQNNTWASSSSIPPSFLFPIPPFFLPLPSGFICHSFIHSFVHSSCTFFKRVFYLPSWPPTPL